MSDDFSKATPRPWAFNDIGAPFCWLEGADGSTIWHIDEYGNDTPNEANARLIAAAVNERDALRQALAEAKQGLTGIATIMDTAPGYREWASRALARIDAILKGDQGAEVAAAMQEVAKRGIIKGGDNG